MHRRHAPLRALFTARHNAAIAALEFALVAPVLFLMFAGMTDLGHTMYMRIRLEAAVAAGANYALVNANKVDSTNAGKDVAIEIATLVTDSNGGTPPNATVVLNDGWTVQVTGGAQSVSGSAGNADSFYCPTGSPPHWSWGTAVAQGGAACADGSTSGKFVTITASSSFTPLISFEGFGPSGTITVNAAVQVQ
jgi:Flp pilus assembly protein TadG